jgi:GNAT superfamily N-acetyltransferase
MGNATLIDVREVIPADYSALAQLMTEMQAHYRAHCPSFDEIIAGLEKRPPGSRLLLALRAGELLGFAAFSGIYPGPGLQPGLFLKELYVAKCFRGIGVGRLLMQRLATVAASENYTRIDWTANVGEPELLSFYESLGGKVQAEKQFYRLADLETLTGKTIGPSKFGSYKGQFELPDSFFDPLPDEEPKAWEGEGNDGDPLAPTVASHPDSRRDNDKI